MLVVGDGVIHHLVEPLGQGGLLEGDALQILNMAVAFGGVVFDGTPDGVGYLFAVFAPLVDDLAVLSGSELVEDLQIVVVFLGILIEDVKHLPQFSVHVEVAGVFHTVVEEVDDFLGQLGAC